MAESALRTRVRAAQKPANPFVFWGILAGCLGLLIVGAAAYFLKTRSEDSAKAQMTKRGVELLNRLTKDVACDYFYTGKKGPLPEEAWASFKGCESDGFFFDAVIITRDLGGNIKILDAARYKEGKSIDGQMMKWGTQPATRRYHGKPGPPPEPVRARIEIVDGDVAIGNRTKEVIFFRRPILRADDKTDFEYGQAVVILYKEREPTPTAAASGAGPAQPEKAPPAGKPEPKPEDKGGPAPAAPEQKPPAADSKPDSKKDAPEPAAKP